MKHFIAIEGWKPKKWKFWFNIYEVVDNKLIFIERWQIGYWMTRWWESEVMNILSSKWYIDAKYTWYYDGHYWKDIDIKYITTCHI